MTERHHDPASRGLASDNYAGIHPEVLEAIVAANGGHVSSYGNDPYTAHLQDLVRQHFGAEAHAFRCSREPAPTSLRCRLWRRSSSSSGPHLWPHLVRVGCGALPQVAGEHRLELRGPKRIFEPSCLDILRRGGIPAASSGSRTITSSPSQGVANELAQAETAFLAPTGQGTFRLRWVTPIAEVALCGHATLAAAHRLWETGALPADEPASFDLQAVAALPAGGLIVTAERDDGGVVSRYLAPAYGIFPEDAVTGSAHCTIGPYWAEELGPTLRAHQASRRGGDLLVATTIGGRVLLAGSARTAATGHLR